MKMLKSEQSVLQKQMKMLDNFATTASKGGTGTKDSDSKTGGGLELTEAFFKTLKDFLQLYSKESSSLERTQLEMNNQIDALQNKINTNRARYAIVMRERCDPDEIRKCNIVVECKDSCHVSLLVSYMTSRASWKPKYDIHVNSAKNLLDIKYSAEIRQSTGEDWVDAKLFLSTAVPSYGSEVPELSTAELKLYKPSPCEENTVKKGSVFGLSSRGGHEILSVGLGARRLMHGVDEVDNAMPSPRAIKHAQTEVGEGMATVMYEIHSRSTIPGDNSEHTVTVRLIDLEPIITFISVPQRSLHAFMLAKVTNSSSCILLSGETSIFRDSSFVGKETFGRSRRHGQHRRKNHHDSSLYR